MTQEEDVLFCVFTDPIWPSAQIRLSPRAGPVSEGLLRGLETPSHDKATLHAGSAPCEAASIRTSVAVCERAVCQVLNSLWCVGACWESGDCPY